MEELFGIKKCLMSHAILDVKKQDKLLKWRPKISLENG